jgi:hypothetical protein
MIKKKKRGEGTLSLSFLLFTPTFIRRGKVLLVTLYRDTLPHFLPYITLPSHLTASYILMLPSFNL